MLNAIVVQKTAKAVNGMPRRSCGSTERACRFASENPAHTSRSRERSSCCRMVSGFSPEGNSPPYPVEPRILVDHLDAELLSLLALGPRSGPGDDEVRLGRDRAGHLGAETLGHDLRLL